MHLATKLLLILISVAPSLQQGSRTFFYSAANEGNLVVTATHTNLKYI